MKESVLNHALQNAWANPLADTPVRIKPARITGINGELISFNYFNVRYALPNRTNRFHIFHMGVYQSNAVMLDKLSKWVWTSMDDLVSNELFIFHGYTDDGMIIPNHDIFAIKTADNGLIFAVRERKQYEIYRKTFFTRFQQNGYYGNPDFDLAVASFSEGKQIETTSDAISLRQSIIKYSALPGHTFVYKNGYLVDFSTIQDEAIGSNLSYVYDSSIKAVLDFKLTELDTYVSGRDANTKYLLHPKKHTYASSVADYIDDVDFYLVHEDDAGESRGVLIYRHKQTDARSITHRDWGLNYDLVQFLLDITKDIETYYIRAFVRHSGQTSRLTYSEDRITELYKLPDDVIYNSLTHHNVVNPDWTAASLEYSAYMDLVSSPYKELDVTDVIRGYGYTSIAKELGYSIIPIDEPNVPLGYAINENVTVFEYDIIGALIGFYYHPAGSSYIPSNENCTYITVMYGKPSSEIDFQDSLSEVTVSQYDDVRVFDCAIQGGEPTRDFTEITNDVTKYRIENGKVIWNLDLDGRYAVVVTNRLLKIHQETRRFDDGIIEIDIPSETGLTPEKVDVFVNAKHLSPEIDYFRIDNEIVLTNKRYVSAEGDNKITVVCKGIRAENIKYQIQEKTGFVVNGKLAVDKHYDLKDDKVLFCFADGRLVPQDDIGWEEDGSGIARKGFNGFPYSVTEAYIALPKLVQYDHFPRRQYSKEKDEMISNLFTGMGLYEKQNEPEMETDYVICSPFMCYILNDIVKGLREPLEVHDSVDKYNDWCERYYKYLDYDPARQFTDQQMQFVKIVPSVHDRVEVTSKMFSFLERVNELYLDKRIVVRDTVVIK